MQILIFGDSIGIPQSLRWIPSENVCGLVVASIRPQYHSDIISIAKDMKIPFLIQPLPSSHQYELFKKSISSLEPDLIWVNSYSMILHEDLLTLSKSGGINIHGALLPQYRGCNPTEWAIINGEHETGATMHEISPGIDEGDIIAQYKVPLYCSDTWRSATDRVYQVTELLIQENIKSILDNSWSSMPQEASNAKYHRRRFFEDGAFEWSQPIYKIYNIVRALVAPHPGASFIGLNGAIEIMDSYESLAEITLKKFKRLTKSYWGESSLQLLPFLYDEYALPVTYENYKNNLSIEKIIEQVCPVDVLMFLEVLRSQQQDQINLLILDHGLKKVIGLAVLSRINVINKDAQLMISVSSDCKDKLTESIALVKKFGLEELNLQIFSKAGFEYSNSNLNE